MNVPRDHICRDCSMNIDIHEEYAYMVHRHVWQQSITMARALRGPGQVAVKDMACIGCLEKRLGRRLRADDFDWNVKLTNDPTLSRSRRLIDRMNNL